MVKHKESQNPNYSTVAEAAQKLGVNNSRVRQFMMDGTLVFERIGPNHSGVLMINKNTLLKFMNERKNNNYVKAALKHKVCSCSITCKHARPCEICKIPTMYITLNLNKARCEEHLENESYYLKDIKDPHIRYVTYLPCMERTVSTEDDFEPYCHCYYENLELEDKNRKISKSEGKLLKAEK